MTYGTVEETIRLSPSMVRVVLGGEGLAGFASNGLTDAYVSALFLQPGSPLGVPFDEDAAKRLPRDERPIPRRLTIRRWDGERIWIDFVVHGNVGVAGRWARSARPGDKLQMRGPAGAYAPSRDAEWHLLVGDESALPAICAALEAVPTGVPVVFVGLVDGPEHELPLDCPGDLRATWLHRDTANPDQLVSAVAGLDLPDGRVHGFIHGEAGETRAVRRHLLADRGIDPADLSLSPYWRRTYTDEAWREIKRDFLAEQEADV